MGNAFQKQKESKINYVIDLNHQSSDGNIRALLVYKRLQTHGFLY